MLANYQNNKGLNYTREEREDLKINGLLPYGVLSLHTQVERSMEQVRNKHSDLEKYIYLQSIQDTNERLYYKLLMDYTKELMPIVYTPTVGQACVEFSRIYRMTLRGVYISIHDVGRVKSLLDQWPFEDIRSIVFTDGERILGLGDLGVNGMGIPIGKLALYSACAGVHPKHCLPVTLDVGTENEKLLKDPYYMGLKQSEKYDQLVDEFMDAAKEKYGPSVLLQFEDFGNRNAFRLLNRYRDTHCTFNDDIQGTAAVVLAGILASLELAGKAIAEHVFVFLGAGEAGTGIADLIALAVAAESGKSIQDARKQIYLVDSKGLVVHSRKKSLQHHKLAYAHEHKEMSGLLQVIEDIKPTVLIGVCTIPKTFNQEICAKMAQLNQRPIIFALSNPTSKAECTAEEAYTWTNGKCIFVSGSPFDPVVLGNQTFVPGQGNNAYIFPGVGLGVLASGMVKIPDQVMLIAAKSLASQVTLANLKTGCVYPPLSEIRKVSLNIAVAVATFGFDNGLASMDKPTDVLHHCKSFVYNP